MRRGEIHFLLPVSVVSHVCRGVAVDIVGVVAGIFCEKSCAVCRADILLPPGLHKGVAVRLAFFPLPHVVHYGSRNASVAVVGVCLCPPRPSQQGTVEVRLGSQCEDVPVLAYGSGIVGYGAVVVLPSVTEGVVSVRREPSRADRHGDAFCQPLLPNPADAQHIAAAVSHFCLHVRRPAVAEDGLACADIHRAGVSEVGRRLEDGALLSVIHAYLLYVVHRELSEVRLSVLCVAEFYSVIIHSEMLRPHRAYVDSLYPSHTAIVLHLYSAEEAQCVGNRHGVQRLQLCAFQCLRRDDVASLASHHRYLSDGIYAVVSDVCRLRCALRCRNPWHGGYQNDEQ